MPATTINKQRLLTTLFTALKKHYGEPGHPPERPVLEQMIYALLREGSTRKDADKAFERLPQDVFRLERNPRLVRPRGRGGAGRAAAPVGQGAAGDRAAAGSLREHLLVRPGRVAQEGHEASRQADRSFTRPPTTTTVALGDAAKHLADTPSRWTPPTLRTARRLGLTEDETNPEAARASLEHQVPKAKGPQFVEYLSLLARDYCWEEEPNCPSCPMRSECLTGVTETAVPGQRSAAEAALTRAMLHGSYRSNETS